MKYEKIIQLIPGVIILLLFVISAVLKKNYVLRKFKENPTSFVVTALVVFVVILIAGFISSKILVSKMP